MTFLGTYEEQPDKGMPQIKHGILSESSCFLSYFIKKKRLPKKMTMEEFKNFEKRLASLEDGVRILALEYASEIYHDHDCSREEALEKAIAKAEMEKREL